MSKRSNYIDNDTVRHLSKRSDLQGAWLVFHVWAVMIASGAIFVIWPNIFTFILAVLLIGARQHGLAILMHDAAHGVLFKSKKLNDFSGIYLLGAPYGGDMHAYRKYHLKHHRYAQQPNDPDLPLSSKFPVSKASMTRKFLRDISGLTFLRLRIASYKMRKGDHFAVAGSDAFQKSSVWPYAITNIVIFGLLAAFGLWWAYFALWLLPLWTVFFAYLRLRNIAEHAMTTTDTNPLTHARTTHANPIARVFLAPYWVNYHVEHHAYMFVPCYHLKALHKELTKNGHKDAMEFKPGYLSVLQNAIVPA